MTLAEATAMSPGQGGSNGTTIDGSRMVVRHPFKPGVLVLNVAVTVIAVAIVISVVANKNIHWDVVGDYLFAGPVLQGLGITLLLTVVCSALGYLLGTGLALFQLAHVRALQLIAMFYIWIFRAVPQMVQLLLWFNIAAIWPTISLGVPFGPEWFSISTRGVINGMAAAIIGLSLSEAAYAAEIVRGGILSVDNGQREAAAALGMSGSRTFLRIILPQAMRSILPPMGNSVIGMLKNTSLVSVIAVSDLLYSTQLIYNRNFEVIPLLLVASTWYVAVTTVLMVVQSRVEKHYGRGYRRINESRSAATTQEVGQ